MKYWMRCLVCSLLTAIVITCTSASSLLAEAEQDQTQQILEKSLSIVEIDQEIKRIQQQLEQLNVRIHSLSSEIADTEQQIEQQRAQAGLVLRAYYMGDRTSWLTLLFSIDSFTQFIRMFDFYTIMLEHDQRILYSFANKQHSLAEAKQTYDVQHQELTLTLSSLEEQRTRISQLQNEVNDQLQNTADPAAIEALIQQLTSSWQSIGLQEVRTYFEALSKAMQDLPELIKETQDGLKISGLNYTLTLREDALNLFLRRKNPIFDYASFRFMKDQLIVTGEHHDVKVEIRGHYSIETHPDHYLLFHVDQLFYNGLELPDTTRHQLEREFDLSFYPSQIISFLQATDLQIDKQVMQVKLKINLQRMTNR